MFTCNLLCQTRYKHHIFIEPLSLKILLLPLFQIRLMWYSGKLNNYLFHKHLIVSLKLFQVKNGIAKPDNISSGFPDGANK